MAFTALIKTLFVPLFISLLLYIVLSYAVLPFVRRHRHRYNQYLPLETITIHTSSARQRIFDYLTSLLFPSSWSRDRYRRSIAHGLGHSDDSDSLFDEDEGEDLVGFDVDATRREALEHRRSHGPVEERRLSRDLEEGFRDDSEEESDHSSQQQPPRPSEILSQT